MNWWRAEQSNGVWYAIRDSSFRVPLMIPRRSQMQAEETATALNRIDYYWESL